MRRIAVLDAPSNLGLRPPTPTAVPGCAKAPGALRDHGLIARLGARDAGCLTPPRYDPGDWRPGDGVSQAPQIASYSMALAARIGAIIDAGEFPVILGGDCSILLGSGLAMHRLGESVGGHIGLVFVDGHSDFRHPGNASYVGAAAGEDLALVTGRGQADLAGLEGRRPYFRDLDVVVLGIRAQDEYRLDLQAAGITTRAVPALRAEGAARTAQWARDELADCAGFWVHVDVDVLDPAVMPAVDAPDPGGIAFAELEILLAGLVETPHCLGIELTVFDPDYDPDGDYAAEIVDAVVAGLAPVGATLPPVHPSVSTDEDEPSPFMPSPPPPAVPAVAVLVDPPADDDAVAERVSGRPRRPVSAAVADEDEPTPAARPGPPRRSMDDALGGVRPGGLRRAADGDPDGAGPRPGGLRRAADGNADGAASRPGGLRRAADGDPDGAGPRPGGLRRAADGDPDGAGPRPGGLRRPAPADAVGDDLTPGSVRPDDAAPPRRSMDDALGDLAGGRLRRSASDGAPRRSMDDALGDITGGRSRGNRPGAAGPGGSGGDDTAAPGRLRRVPDEPDDTATQNGAAHP